MFGFNLVVYLKMRYPELVKSRKKHPSRVQKAWAIFVMAPSKNKTFLFSQVSACAETDKG